MARTPYDDFAGQSGSHTENHTTISADGQQSVEVPDSQFISDADMTRDGQDLVLQAPDGSVIVIEGYFAANPPPTIESPDGGVLTPSLVDSFVHGGAEYASNASMSDESPIGAVEEVSGNATVTHADGTTETITIGTPIYQGDVIETDAEGAVNVVFIDETSMAVSENARMAIDEYVFDPTTESGSTNFSVLRGVFVFTSGLIGRDDPDDVEIDTPVGSIGIRGTIIAGKIDPGGDSEITVVEGAIVVKNGTGEHTLSLQFQTLKLGGFNDDAQDMGVMDARDVGHTYGSVSGVVPTLFSSINDAAKSQEISNDAADQGNQPAPVDSEGEAPGSETLQEKPAEQNPQQPVDVKPTGEQPPVQTQPTGTKEGSVQPTQQPLVDPVFGDPIGSDPKFSDATTIHTVTGAPAGSAGSGTTAGGTSGAAASGSTGSSGSTTQSGSGSTGTSTTGTTNILPLELAFQGGQVPDDADSGFTVGSVSTTVFFQNVNFKFGNGSTISSNGNFMLVPDGDNHAKIVLTAAGETALQNNNPVGSFVVQATLSDGRSITKTYSSNIFDPDASTTLTINEAGAGTNGVVKISDNIGNKIGHSITALGDVNNDGFADFAFSNNNGTQSNTYVLLGSAAGVAGGNLGSAGVTAGITTLTDGAIGAGNKIGVLINPNEGGVPDQTKISGIGDFDGDGVEDFVVGLPHDDDAYGGPATNTGSAFIVSGANGQTIGLDGQASNTETGYSVSGIGDINNDGYTDVLISAPNEGAGGRAYVLYGGLNAFGTPVNLGGITGNGIVLTGSTGASFGESVAAIGDINGDGRQDFAVGAPGEGGSNLGALHIYNGDGSQLTSIAGTNSGQGFGEAVFGLGDFNGDGYSDIMVADKNATSGEQKAYFVMGGASLPTIGAEVTIDTTTGKTIAGGGTVGDFNGDGYDDAALVIRSGTKADIYVIYGSDNPQNLDLNLLNDPRYAFHMEYKNIPALASDFDFEIGAIGDVNGDGLDDIGIGVQSANGGNGEVYTVYGRMGGDADYVRDNGSGDSNATAKSVQASSNNQSLLDKSGDDNFFDNNKTGLSMRGGHGDNNFNLTNANFMQIDGGGNKNLNDGGYDTIRYGVNGGTLDFTNVKFEQISQIERLQFSEDGATIRLTLDNLFNLLRTSDTGTLKIENDGSIAGSQLIIDDQTASDPVNDDTGVHAALLGVASGTTYTDAGTHHQYDIGGYTLYIDKNVALDVQ